MIDTHNHLLPGVDDGAQDREEMLEMCRIASLDGIRVIVATPHSFDDEYLNEPQHIKTIVSDLNRELNVTGIDLRVLPGMETRVSPDLEANLAEGKVLTLNEGRYVLVEFHPAHLPSGFENLASRLVESGRGLIVAHPEKNFELQRHPEYLFYLLQLFEWGDLLVQITASSILGKNGYRARATAKNLLKSNLAHLIATDAHDAKMRPPTLARAVEIAANLVGPQRAAQMVTDVPLAVLEGKGLPPAWEPDNPRRWWRLY
ncbi:MAG: tyrosine protein phosphatase [Deltaproteobacteria bacterium]|nr:tyrosine protein phosphatase [Deltaproteobacteria bacterium]